eukprot:gb/GECG01013072.1/.p1 GENE.gb/GECG01013072.1/~~gb/GECG01013072.1/.p1  ORF type:complete len:218 (+),score=30.47 gb/GECG01013072.1/:1-654(+)
MQPDNDVVKSMMAELEEEEKEEGKDAPKENSPSQAKYTYYSGAADSFGALQHVRASATAAHASSSTVNSNIGSREKSHSYTAPRDDMEEESSEDDSSNLGAETFAKGIRVQHHSGSGRHSSGYLAESIVGGGAAHGLRAKEEAESVRSFVHQPGEKGRFTMCYIIRKKHLVGNPTYYVYLEKDDQYLMCAQVRYRHGSEIPRLKYIPVMLCSETQEE